MKSASSRSAKPRAKKNPSSSKASATEWQRVQEQRDADISITEDHPEADVKHIVRTIVRRGLRQDTSKTAISLRIDSDVLAWFKDQGPGYQTRINAVLRAYMKAADE